MRSWRKINRENGFNPFHCRWTSRRIKNVFTETKYISRERYSMSNNSNRQLVISYHIILCRASVVAKGLRFLGRSFLGCSNHWRIELSQEFERGRRLELVNRVTLCVRGWNACRGLYRKPIWARRGASVQKYAIFISAHAPPLAAAKRENRNKDSRDDTRYKPEIRVNRNSASWQREHRCVLVLE